MSKKAAAPLAPKFTDPGPALALADVPGMPGAVSELLAGKGIRTLADLRPLCESHAAADPTCEPVSAVLGQFASELPLINRYRAGDALMGLLGGRARMLKVMSGWPVSAPNDGSPLHPEPGPKPDDFDESTPPPRSRPKGEPVPRHLELPPGEPVVELFERWDRDGRIPPGCVLAERVRDGQVLRAGVLAGVPVGWLIPVDVLNALVMRASVVLNAGRFPEVPRSFVVLSGGRS